MVSKFSSFVKRLLVFFNILAVLVFLLACVAPYLNPQKWWMVSIIGLGFAIALGIQILFIFLWLVVKPRFVFISLISLLLGWKSISVFFAVRSRASFNYDKPKQVLRVGHWNVARFIEWSRNNNEGSQIRLNMMKQLKAQNADVLCLVEFFQSSNPLYYNNINYVMKELGYPYYYFSWDDDGGDQWVGQAIFSRHPIIDSSVVQFDRPTRTESLIQADIVFNQDTIRILTTHLQSVRFKRQDFESIERIKKRDEDQLLENSKSIFGKLKNGFISRSKQADAVRAKIDQSPYPCVVTGDFNDVPNSYTYFKISDNLQDAFLKKGFGIGRTFAFISPTLRIDYILASKAFKVSQFHREAKILSDHYMLVADLQLSKETR